MSTGKRSALQQQVVESLLASKAIDLEAVGATLSKFGERSAIDGDTLVHIINRRFLWACGWPGPELDVFEQQVDG